MTIAVGKVDHRSHQGGGLAHKILAKEAGGGHALMRSKLLASGDVAMASRVRLGREARARTTVRYRLRHKDGSYVNLDLSGETRQVAHAWIGFAHQLEAVRHARPDLSDYVAIPVHPKANSTPVQVRLGAGRGVMG